MFLFSESMFSTSWLKMPHGTLFSCTCSMFFLMLSTAIGRTRKEKQAKKQAKEGLVKKVEDLLMLMVVLELSRDTAETLIKWSLFSIFWQLWLIYYVLQQVLIFSFSSIYTTALFLSLMCGILVISSCGLQFLSYIVQNTHCTTCNQVFQYERKSLQDLQKTTGLTTHWVCQNVFALGIFF